MNSLAREITMNAAVSIPEPVWALPPFNQFVTLEWSFHALQEAARDDFWHSPMVTKVDRSNVVEVTVAPGANDRLRVTKIVLRIPSPDKTDDRDMVLVIVPRKNRGGGWFVVTAYANSKDDRHFTLDVSRIAPVEEINRVVNLLVS